MHSSRKWGKFALVLVLLALTAGCWQASSAQAQGLYTQFNFWYERPLKMYSINYKKGTLIPAGTEVSGVEISRKYIKFKASGESFRIRFYPKYHPGETSETLGQKMFSTKNLSQLTAGMTAREIKGIKEGVLYPGMSKNSVLVAYGFPPGHETAGLESDRWKFWMSRWTTKTICFGENKKILKCENL